jgi:hypothetical protein
MTLEPRKRRDPSRAEPINRCTAHRRNGDQCRNSAIKGATVCRVHGGSAPQVQRAAAVRLLMAADSVAGELVRIALSKKAADGVKVQAILGVLDRAGLSARQEITIEAKVETWETRVQAAVVDWGELAALTPNGGINPDVVYAEVVQDEAHERAWDERLEAPRDAPIRQRPSEVEDRLDAMPVKPPKVKDEDELPPWVGKETGSQHAERLADEHRRRAFAADKATKGLTPRTRRKR